MEKYLTSEQVATILQVHPFTVLKYLKKGTLEGVKIGRVYRIKESEVEKFLDDMTIVSSAKKRPKDEKIDPNQASINSVEKNTADTNGIKESFLGKTDSHKVEFNDDEIEDGDPYYKIL